MIDPTQFFAVAAVIKAVQALLAELRKWRR
jgi:hypothetical protein